MFRDKIEIGTSAQLKNLLSPTGGGDFLVS